MTIHQFPRKQSTWFYKTAQYYLKMEQAYGQFEAAQYLRNKVPQQLIPAVLEIVQQARSA